MHHKLVEIADQLKKRFLDESEDSKEMSIFLCGGSKAEEEEFRRKVGKRISEVSSSSKYRYSVYYPEDMFIELILGHQKKDLLTLENLLADGAHAVVILLQSPGTFTELGAFTNYEKLNDKLVVVIEPRFAKSRSFINLGPVRYLKAQTKSKVLYIPMDNGHLGELVKQVTSAVRDAAKLSSPTRDLASPISAYRFYLALIYTFEPVPRASILAISRTLATGQQETAEMAAETVINSLINERKVSFSSGNLSTTPKGVDELIYGNETRKRARKVLSFLTELRIQALNLTLRNKYTRIWGEAK